MFKVLLYYKYVDLSDSKSEVETHKQICQSFNLLGRVLIADEGINGTLCGTPEACQKYIDYMNQHEYFHGISFKESSADFMCFNKLKIKHKKEIVRLDNTKFTIKDAAPAISADEAQDFFENQNENSVVFDVRNDYEWKIGAFKGAWNANIKTFRELPEYVEKNQDRLKDKDVLMVCTGDVRCELSSAYIKSLGIAKRVRHIYNGIHGYVEKYPNGHFDGRNYVFDDRISIKVNDNVLSSCEICNTKCDLYNNCINALCNKRYICCDTCLEKYEFACSKECQEKVSLNLAKKRTVSPSRVRI